MKSPLDRDVVLANAVGVATGVQAHRQGAHPIDVFNVGMWWRSWYKNMTLSIALLVLVAIIAVNTGQWGFVAIQAVLNVVVLGITYAKLVMVSEFKQRSLFRVFWPLARHFPYTARFWFYLTMFLPIWTLMFIRSTHTMGGRW